MLPDPPTIPFSLIGEPLDSLATAVGNKMEREWTSRFRGDHLAQGVLVPLLRSAENTFRTIRFVCSDRPDGTSRKPEYAVAVPPLVRTLCDALYTVTFLSQSLSDFTAWYWKSGWREAKEDYDRHESLYGDSPHWRAWLDELALWLKKVESDFCVTSDELADPRLVRYFPTPSQMRRSDKVSETCRVFFGYLHDWFNKRLSAASHLSGRGLLDHVAPLLNTTNADNKVKLLQKQASDAVLTSVSLFLALLSELIVLLGYDLHQRARYIWGILVDFWGEARELYERRYQDLLEV